jgi:mycothiol synthase
VHLLGYEGDELVGYAHVDPTDHVEGASAELVVHPLRRRRGRGRALVQAAISAAAQAATASMAATESAAGHGTPGRLRLWAHGDHPSANALALSLGFHRARVLWQMRRSLFAPVAAPHLPDGVTLRSFRPEEDVDNWLAVNNRAFADHPDQGRWTRQDLCTRVAEPWFDPEGFLLAERTGTGDLLGFHWTKVHGEIRDHPHPDGTTPHQHDPIGEVYVLGVDPAAQGLGLGAALTMAGLRYLRTLGLDQVMLYVESTNQPAITLYTRLGFARWSTDVCFARAV